ncbi:hypothetical protein CBR_g51037 [Chara braunii]|uniref:CCHC-type domain-containing protein n=1 Tax=Chara braunii TaxID=69332 RepID=A0A388K5V5_CHABU|nr:hypothetical protein CBR_g51037 [Chara braunii]|eukprot:GBG65442.1 hypothetical protein CBR_g51037 [Chara braunii]
MGGVRTSGFVPTCYGCGMVGHIRRECPNRPHVGGVNNYSGAMVNVQPAQPLLALPVPPSTRGQVQPTQYQAPRSNNCHPRMGERVDKIEEIVGRLDTRDRWQQEKEEQKNRKREEEEGKATREKERKDLEEAIGAQMETRFKNMYEVYFGKKKEEGSEIDKLKRQVEQLHAASTSQGKTVLWRGTEGEQRQLEDSRRWEGDLLRTLVGLDLWSRGIYCQQRCLETTETTIGVSDEAARLRREMDEFQREAALGRSGLEKRLELLALENEQLRKRTERADQEVLIWKGEALRPGNKRGQVALQGTTTTGGSQGRTRARIVLEPLGGTSSMRELKNQRAKYQATLDEVDILKKIKVDALAEAIKQKERDERLVNMGKVAGTPVSNLRLHLEQVAGKKSEQGIKKSKCKAAPGITSSNMKKVNNRCQFIKEQKKGLGKKNKAQLTEICERMGLTYKKIDITVDEIMERRVNDAFGSFDSARMHLTREKSDQEEVERMKLVKMSQRCMRCNRTVNDSTRMRHYES